MTSRVSQEIVEVAYLVTPRVTVSQEIVEIAYSGEIVNVSGVHADVVHRMTGNQIRVGSIIIEYAYVDEFGRRQGPAVQ